jgi:hypothetical protein
VLYLAIIGLGMFGELYVRGALVHGGDAAATAAAISAAPSLWRAGIAGDLLMQVLDVPVIVVFYLLLRPFGAGLALFATLINLVQTAVLAVNKLTLLAPLILLRDSATLAALDPAQRQALAYAAIGLHDYGFAVGLVFFGFACLATGWLMFTSRILPRVLGLLMIAAGLSYLVNSVALILAPEFAAAIFPAILLPAFIGESAVALWLVVKGVDVAQWRQQVAGAGQP